MLGLKLIHVNKRGHWGMGYWANFLRALIFFRVVEIDATYWIPRLYLTGVAAAQLRWHLSNMKVIWKNLKGTFAISKVVPADKLTNGALVLPTLDRIKSIFVQNKMCYVRCSTLHEVYTDIFTVVKPYFANPCNSFTYIPSGKVLALKQPDTLKQQLPTTYFRPVCVLFVIL